MRRIAVSAALVGLVASFAIADSTRVPPLEVTFEQVPETVPVTLTKDGELFAIEVDGTKATCERWTVDATNGQLKRGGLTLEYHVAHGELVIDGTALVYPDGEMSSTCTAHQEVHESAEWLETEGAHLFRTRERCQAAVAKKERVAFQPPCDLDPGPAATPDEKSRARFERILDKGGTMYAVMWQEEREVCRTVRFNADKPRDRQYAGVMSGGVSYRVTDGAVNGTETYGYELRPGETQMTILGPSWQWDSGVGGAMGCASFVEVAYGKTYVESFAKLHFTAGACWAELHEHQTAEQWYPDPETISHLGDTPLAGGC
ncbi:hypothetical protein BH11MYX2_BH11MYX2_27980 [soil metagenome]